jgi:hypothetical protein
MRIAHLDTPTLNVRPHTKPWAHTTIDTSRPYTTSYMILSTIGSPISSATFNICVSQTSVLQFPRCSTRSVHTRRLEILQFLRATPVYTDGNYPRDIGDSPLKPIIRTEKSRPIRLLGKTTTTDRDSLVSAGRALLWWTYIIGCRTGV